MRNARLWVVSIVSISLTLAAIELVRAQEKPAGGDAAKIAPDVYKVKLENDRVRVLETTLPAGGKSAMHSHPEHIVCALTDGKVKFTAPDGKSEVVELKAGDVLSLPATTHSAENVGEKELKALNIELKPAAAAK